MTQKTKTAAKRIGIKSVLLHGDDQVTITTFGKGNAAEIAITTDSQGTNLAQTYEPRNITAKAINSHGEKRGIECIGTVAGNPLEVLLNIPTENVGEDYLRLKGTLEKEFFGKEFPNDNVRIQIIHNILDIQKLLGIYVNDIIYTINNLQELPPDTPPEETDIVGLAMNDNKKVKERLKRIMPYVSFFGEAFYVPKKDRNGKISPAEIETADKHNIAVLRVLGTMRQATAHFKDLCLPFSKNDKLPKKFQKQDDDKTHKITQDNWSVVDQLYKKRIDNINDDFMNKSKMNLCILFDLLNATDDEEKSDIAEEYYRFSILKEGKNLGVNMKLLREVMLKKYYPSVKDEMHDSYRSKIYAITDYLLFRECSTKDEKGRIVLKQEMDWDAKLRETQDDDEKETLYNDFACTAWEKVKSRLEPFYKKFNGTFPAFDSEAPDLRFIDNTKLKTETELSLVKLLSFLCNFWEGKEINELLSAYIHKFENIQTFIDTLKKLNKKEKVQFSDRYGLFNEYGNNNPGNIAKQLRHIVSIGKMKPDLKEAKCPLYKAAIEMLGAQDKYVSDEWLEANVLTGDNLKKKSINPFRNFIAKQVIESRRFQYLVRYTKPKTVRALMKNPHIVHYVLQRISNIKDVHVTESQIDKYYKNLPEYDKSETRLDAKIDALTKYLTDFSFTNIEDQRKFIVNKLEDRNKAIEKLKALTGLYLTVAYIAVKNLVKTNARYYIAFACFDRDLAMFKQKLNIPKDGWKFGTYDNYFALTEYFLDKDDSVRYIPDPNKSDEENKKALFKPKFQLMFLLNVC
ncbi:MAG: type VI-D CRISPR-associated RNA-guided ribonuclease Cas13d [Planctomycetaceae bacterium]|jgi:hypothetical protein|nr:type VI-D CRISPR-associated RNA-guided ribonuclease Cas13d [Planctomycetaceae bacterium]